MEKGVPYPAAGMNIIPTSASDLDVLCEKYLKKENDFYSLSTRAALFEQELREIEASNDFKPKNPERTSRCTRDLNPVMQTSYSSLQTTCDMMAQVNSELCRIKQRMEQIKNSQE